MVEIVLLLAGLGLLAFYFLPTFIAGVRDHHASVGILALNLFLGWTVIGWLGALFWAFGRIRRDEAAEEEFWEEEDEEFEDVEGEVFDPAGEGDLEEPDAEDFEEEDFEDPPPPRRR